MEAALTRTVADAGYELVRAAIRMRPESGARLHRFAERRHGDLSPESTPTRR